MYEHGSEHLRIVVHSFDLSDMDHVPSPGVRCHSSGIGSVNQSFHLNSIIVSSCSLFRANGDIDLLRVPTVEVGRVTSTDQQCRSRAESRRSPEERCVRRSSRSAQAHRLHGDVRSIVGKEGRAHTNECHGDKATIEEPIEEHLGERCTRVSTRVTRSSLNGFM